MWSKSRIWVRGRNLVTQLGSVVGNEKQDQDQGTVDLHGGARYVSKDDFSP